MSGSIEKKGSRLRRRTRKKATAVARVALPLPSEPGRCYAMDFVHDRLANGRRFKCFTITDLCSKDVPVIEVDASIGGEQVCLILDRLFVGRPLPETVILDNGPEFAGTALHARGKVMTSFGPTSNLTRTPNELEVPKFND